MFIHGRRGRRSTRAEQRIRIAASAATPQSAPCTTLAARAAPYLPTSKKTPDGIVNPASVERSLRIVVRRVREYDALPTLRCGPHGPEQLFLGERLHAIYRYFHCSAARRVRRADATSTCRACSCRYGRHCAGTGRRVCPRGGSRSGTRICRCGTTPASGTGGSCQCSRGPGIRASTPSAGGKR